MFNDDEQLAQLRDIRKWSKTTTDGSLSDLKFQPFGQVWDEAASDSGNCMGRRCPTYNKCFYYKDRRRASTPRFSSSTMPLLFSDIALRRAGVSILPDYDVVILDEAHTVEGVASDHLGINVTSGQVEYALNKLYNDRTNKGLLVHHGLFDEQQQVDRCRHLADELFGDLWQWKSDQRVPTSTTPGSSRLGRGANSPLRVAEPAIVANRLSPELESLARKVKQAGKKLSDESEQQDFFAAHDRLIALAAEIETWRMQAQSGTVYWLESYQSRRGTPRLTLAAAPIDIGPAMREQLFDKVPTVIMTSATLSVGRPSSDSLAASERGRSSFDFFKSRVGVTQCDEIQVGSPFNYREQVEFVTLRDMPDPASEERGAVRKEVHRGDPEVRRPDRRPDVCAVHKLRHAAPCGRGHATLACVAQSSAPEPGRRHAANATPRTVQNRSAGRPLWHRQFLARCRCAGRRAANGHHRQAAVCRTGSSAAESPAGCHPRGGRQSVSRLSASGSRDQIQARFRPTDSQPFDDHGTVVCLDPRIVTKPYGRLFIESLPDCKRVQEPLVLPTNVKPARSQRTSSQRRAP